MAYDDDDDDDDMGFLHKPWNTNIEEKMGAVVVF